MLGDGTTVQIDSVLIGQVDDVRAGGGGFEAVPADDLSTTGLRPFLQSASEDGGEITMGYHSASSKKPARGNHVMVLTLPDGTELEYYVFTMSEETTIGKKALINHSLRMKVLPSDNPSQT